MVEKQVPDKQKYQRIEIFMGRLLLSIIAFMVAFVLIEMLSRKFISLRPPIERRFPVKHVRHPRPYSMFGGKAHAENLNSMGYRGDVPQMPKPFNEYRIFFLGGSTVYNGKPPIAGLVEELFHKDGILNAKVYNFGVVSSVSGMELARIVFEISDLAPDLIVMYNGGNDKLAPYSWDPRPGYPFNFIVYENNPLLDKDIEDYPTTALLLYGSHIMRYFFRDYFIDKFTGLKQLRKENKHNSPQWKEKVADIYVRNLVKADKISNAFGAEFIAFYQPMVFFKKSVTDDEKVFLHKSQGKFVRETRVKIHSKINKAKVEYGVNIVDLSDIYRKNPNRIFKDVIHITQEAKNIVARHIYKRLVDIYKKKDQEKKGSGENKKRR